MGAVYKAEQPQMNRFVAVKILHSKYLSRADLVSRFRREARAMSHLSHPNTARVFLYGQLDDGACYFVMEYLEGMNLAQLVRGQGPMGPNRASRVMIQVCGALHEAHSAGIIHRDLKPENVFLTQQGGIKDFPKVLDFGLAKVTEREMRPGSLVLTREGMIFGTPEFMSPEQARGRTLDARSDIYSLGLIFYELLTGKLPFEASNSMEFINHQVNTAPIPLSERTPGLVFGAELDGLVMKSLEKEADDRFQTAAEFADALTELLDAARASSTPPSGAAAASDVPAPAAAGLAAGPPTTSVAQAAAAPSKMPLVLLSAAFVFGIAAAVLITYVLMR
jgi:serine/threonine-protein kinase